ncbi:MAG: family 20 glycosylhydrolase [FCB group bacterium]|nr:family 20 glycosylhydrolase [FCB group bacterium]MBL7026983.1 family 20 glycosylhydrolase [Candidatus Neomarinimicrobiota bacterium]MBL7122163.1 family 20 glycosylhydrolase [Candidatus Neomarinimicrobiota bacterium]
MKIVLRGTIVLLICMQVFLACSTPRAPKTESMDMNIIPKPQSIMAQEGEFIFAQATSIWISDEIANKAFFIDYLRSMIPNMSEGTQGEADIEFDLIQDVDLPEEGYHLQVSSQEIRIIAKDDPGLFYGIQTLRQLLPPAIEQGVNTLVGHKIQAVNVEDYPRFGWRGMHLDVSRHFFPLEFVKRYIDMIALHKMNVFHWHLSDDNGWRLEIKRYPKLTEICAWRVDREHEDWRKWSPIEAGEKSTYGGFYTQDEVREVIGYAASRQITVIPEIEMPGHSSEIFAAYPELSCKGETLPVRPGSYWPNEDIFCGGNDSVFVFLENILDEVVELFPAEYIHIGGDEARKTYWKTCEKCQNRIKTEGLTNEHELQSWFIQKMEKYILSKGKKLIGWDEILEGGLAEDATVMSWRGVAGGVAAAKAGHDVVMTPTSHVYFDYYQGDPKTEPQAIGGYTPLKKVYSYEPIPKELDADEAKYVLGSQANLWTEFIKTTSHAEYMVLPRMTALSEVLWSSKDQRDWPDFQKRLQALLPRFESLGWNYSPGTFLVDILPGQPIKTDELIVELISEQSNYEIRYTLDGTDPDVSSHLYMGKLLLRQDAKVRAGIFDGPVGKGRIAERDFSFHQALGSTTAYKLKYHVRYTGGGDQGLVDGILGSDNSKDGTWQGFEGNDLELTLDLGESKEIFRTEMNFLQSTKAWIFMPQYLEVSFSPDGEAWRVIQRVDNEVSDTREDVSINRLTADFPAETTRYIRILAKNRGVCPDWHPGSGEKSWIFCDEVVVR